MGKVERLFFTSVTIIIIDYCLLLATKAGLVERHIGFVTIVVLAVAGYSVAKEFLKEAAK